MELGPTLQNARAMRYRIVMWRKNAGSDQWRYYCDVSGKGDEFPLPLTVGFEPTEFIHATDAEGKMFDLRLHSGDHDFAIMAERHEFPPESVGHIDFSNTNFKIRVAPVVTLWTAEKILLLRLSSKIFGGLSLENIDVHVGIANKGERQFNWFVRNNSGELLLSGGFSIPKDANTALGSSFLLASFETAVESYAGKL